MHQSKHLSQHLPAKAIGTTTPSTRQDGCHFCLPTPSRPVVLRSFSQTVLTFLRSHTRRHSLRRSLSGDRVPAGRYLDGGHLPHATSCQPSHSEKNQTLSLRHQPVWIDGRNTKPTAHTSQQPHTGAPAWIGDFRHPKLSIDTTTSL